MRPAGRPSRSVGVSAENGGRESDDAAGATVIGPASPLVLQMANGQSIGPIAGPPVDGEDVQIELIGEIRPRIFDRCPICSDPATQDEHVPPRSVGGKKMTRTCRPCNNRLGSLVEPDLLDWLDGVVLSAQLRSERIGHRPGSVPRLAIRQAPQGLLLLADGDEHLDLVLRAGGQMTLRWRSIDYRRCWIALLKQAYLASCLRFGILDGAILDSIRAELISVRDVRSRAAIPRTPLAERLKVAARAEPIVGVPPVVEAKATYETDPIPGVLLVGRVFVGWAIGPARDTPMAGSSEYSIPLTVGNPIEGMTVPAQ